MLQSLAILLPLCSFAVATDAPNPDAVYRHETAHCYGWTHPDHAFHGVMNDSYRAPEPPLRYRLLGAYPPSRLTVYFDTGRNVARLYCNGNAYGCQWFNKERK